jgi:hypothetical protein
MQVVGPARRFACAFSNAVPAKPWPAAPAPAPPSSPALPRPARFAGARRNARRRADVAWNGPGTPVLMTGPAVTVFKGEIEVMKSSEVAEYLQDNPRSSKSTPS